MATVLSTVRKYIPTFGDNDKKIADDQIVAYLKNINIKQRQEQIKKFLKIKPEDLLAQLMDDQQSKEIQAILKENVVRFDNFKIDDGQKRKGDDGKDEPALRDGTIDDLYSMGEFGICVELFMNIINNSQLSVERAKNSESQSGSTRPSLLVGEVVETAH